MDIITDYKNLKYFSTTKTILRPQARRPAFSIIRMICLKEMIRILLGISANKEPDLNLWFVHSEVVGADDEPKELGSTFIERRRGCWRRVGARLPRCES